MAVEPSFLFITCQVGAEPAVKHELSLLHPDFRFAYSRPGFLTFKLPPRHGLKDDFELGAVFARAYGFSLGKVEGASVDDLATLAIEYAARGKYDAMHVWQRDLAAPGRRGFEPGISAAAIEAEAAIRRHPSAIVVAGEPVLPPHAKVTQPGEIVLDCVLVEPLEWWLGYHRARPGVSCWPGGICPLPLPEAAVSRAYLKIEEALAWSRLPVKSGQRCVEIGCSPGGASAALLNRGLLVTGIDPAEVDPRVVEHPNFVHIRKRGADVRRREFRKTRWLFADMNVAPHYTLDTVEAIVTHAEVRVRGLLLMLKLLDWNLAAEVPSYLSRVRGWGYPKVIARQLHHNRQEICVAAME